jgi:hypothetical protein
MSRIISKKRGQEEKLARFTSEQKNISEAVKLMIDLYYYLKDAKQESWFSDKVIEMVSKMLGLTIPNFYPCLYFQKYSYFRFREKEEKVSLLKSHLAVFIEFIDAIKNDIGNGIHDIFKIVGMVQEIRQSFEFTVQPMSFRKGSADVKFPVGTIQCRIVSPLSEDADAKSQDEYLDLQLNALNQPCHKFESFQVSVNGDSHLYENLFEEKGGRISAIGYIRPDASFLHAIKFILVKYQYLMGSYERLKLCNQCEKLFLEKKIGSKEYCSPSCRKKYYDALQIPEIRKCRERQNAWIRYKYKNIVLVPRIYYLHKDECDGCTGAVKGGDCKMLRNKNKKAFKVIAKQK